MSGSRREEYTPFLSENNACCRLVELPSSPRSEPNEAHQKVALVLAALGWQASTSLSNAIECPEDGRTVGLWRFENTSARSPAAAPAVESAQPEAGLGSSSRALVERGQSAAGTQQVSGGSALTVKPCESIDPIGEHRCVAVSGYVKFSRS